MSEWIGYLAAMIDGEGTVGIYKSPPSKNGFSRYLFRVRIGINQEEPLKFLQSLFGGNLRKRRTTNDYELEWNGVNAKRILKEVLDHLLIKKEQALLFLSCPQHDSPLRFSAEERKERERCYLKMKELNASRTTFSFSVPHSIGVGEEKEDEDG